MSCRAVESFDDNAQIGGTNLFRAPVCVGFSGDLQADYYNLQTTDVEYVTLFLWVGFGCYLVHSVCVSLSLSLSIERIAGFERAPSPKSKRLTRARGGLQYRQLIERLAGFERAPSPKSKRLTRARGGGAYILIKVITNLFFNL